MNHRTLHIILFFILVVGFIPATAQDAGMSDLEIVDGDAGGETVVYTPGEDLRYIPKASGSNMPQDSIVLQMQDFPMQQAAMRATDRSGEKQTPAKPKDDSILTFNFLYYIIQKYKLQDIID